MMCSAITLDGLMASKRGMALLDLIRLFNKFIDSSIKVLILMTKNVLNLRQALVQTKTYYRIRLCVLWTAN